MDGPGRFCGRCGTQSQDGDEFCQSCGHELGQPTRPEPPKSVPAAPTPKKRLSDRMLLLTVIAGALALVALANSVYGGDDDDYAPPTTTKA